jgi:uncharacterized protein (UPF0332 family)/predicted nucleotidyltransferase
MDILRQRRRALERFKGLLLNDGVKDRVAKIILFGSVAKGEDTGESDIDILILATDELEKVSEASADAALRTGIETGVSVEPLIYCQDQLRFPHSFFISKALIAGKEIYSMAEKKLRREEARSYLNLAEIYLEGAKRSYEAGDLRIAMDAGYNAAELCVKGLLLLKADDLPKTHGGVVTKFGELYVKRRILPASTGRELHLALERRNKARYDYHAEIGERDVKKTLGLVAELVTALKAGVE